MKKIFYVFLLLCFLPAASWGTPTTVFGPSLTTDADFFNFLDSLGPVEPYGGERYVAQGRIGDAGGAATYEIGLHGPPNFTNAGPIAGGSSQYAWSDETPVPFNLSRNAGTVTFSMGDYSASIFDPSSNLLAIRYRVAPFSSLGFSDLEWNGDSGVAGYVGVSVIGGEVGGVLYWALSDLGDDFEFTGSATFGWQDTMPTQSNLAFQIKGFEIQSVPEPATMLLLGVGLIGLAGIGRKKFK